MCFEIIGDFFPFGEVTKSRYFLCEGLSIKEQHPFLRLYCIHLSEAYRITLQNRFIFPPKPQLSPPLVNKLFYETCEKYRHETPHSHMEGDAGKGGNDEAADKVIKPIPTDRVELIDKGIPHLARQGLEPFPNLTHLPVPPSFQCDGLRHLPAPLFQGWRRVPTGPPHWRCTHPLRPCIS